MSFYALCFLLFKYHRTNANFLMMMIYKLLLRGNSVRCEITDLMEKKKDFIFLDGKELEKDVREDISFQVYIWVGWFLC